jgi:hypothetical protein
MCGTAFHDPEPGVEWMHALGIPVSGFLTLMTALGAARLRSLAGDLDARQAPDLCFRIEAIWGADPVR